VNAAPAANSSAKPIAVVMGVAGSGKSLIGRMLAERCGFAFVEGDDLHPAENVDRMTHGLPLDDTHREVWLGRIADAISSMPQDGGLVVTCSALKRSYRDRLRAASPHVVFLHLVGGPDLIHARMKARSGHFMPPSLLASQFDDLEPPQPDEPAITLDARGAPDAVVAQACDFLSGVHTELRAAGERP
jgi:gluconokinase